MLRYGFYNSVNGDRKYEADDMGRLFDGIIEDGVFYSIGDKFRVEPASGMNITVGTGRAWFNRTWSDLDAPMTFEIPTESIPRTYYVALIVDKRTGETQRKNTIELLTYTEWQAKQGITNVYPYALAKIDVPASVTLIRDNMITNYVGGDEEPIIPFVISPVQSIDLTPFIEHWEEQIDTVIDEAVDEYFEGIVVVKKLADIGGGYAVCDTAEATLAKTAVITDFVPTHGGIFCIKFTNAVPTSSTLNISNGTALTGQKPIYYKDSRALSGTIKAGDIVTFVYDSTPGTGFTNGRYHVISIDEDETGSSGEDNVVYGEITNLQATITPGIIYDAIVTQGKNLWYCLFDHYSKLVYTLQRKPENATNAYFVAFDDANRQISVATLNTQGAVTFTAYPLGGPTPTWNDIKPSSGIPTSDLADDTNSKWGIGFGVCTTGQATAAKTVSISGYKLVQNGFVAIRFTNAVNSGATLSINGQTAKTIYHAGAALSSGVIRAGETCVFVYDGSYYQLVAILPSGSVVLELSKSGTTVYLGMTFADAYAAFTSPWNTYLLLQIDTGVPLLMRPSKVDSVNSEISIEATVGTTLYTTTLSPVVGQAQMSGTLTQTTINDASVVTSAAVANAIGGMTVEQIGGVVSDLDVVPSPVKVTVSDSAYTCAAQDNRIYSCGELSSLTIVDSAQNISFTVDFTSGSTATVLSVPSGYKAPGGELTPEANKTYELNVRNGKAVLTPFEAVSASA